MAVVLRLRGVVAVPCHEQFGGARIAEYFLEQPGAAIARNDAALDETAREFRAFRGDADIAGAGQVAAQADSVAVARGHHRDFAIHPHAANRLHSAAVIAAGRIGLLDHAVAPALLHAHLIPARPDRLPG